MKTFECKDVGFSDCAWSVSGQTDEEIMAHAAEHGRQKHGIQEITEELKNKVLSKIREVKDKVA
jgi:predicted small metal-binding protein